MKRNIFNLAIWCAALCLASCSLDESPQAQADKNAIFNNASGLETYTLSFYNSLPRRDNGFKQDNMSDYGPVSTPDLFLRDGAYTSESSSGWSKEDWATLRNINYFIENCTSPQLSAEVKDNYIGLARFFRAYFYYNMLTRFGDVPWIDKPLAETDSMLYQPRDSRTVVVDKMIADLDFACTHITRTADASGTMITRWIPYLFKSRLCLFEGTYRKYHTELGLASTAPQLLQQAADAAAYVMDHGPYSLYTADGAALSQRALFIAEKPITQETMLAAVSSEALNKMGCANWWWTSSTFGDRFSLTRTFINTFLKLDGTPYTDTAGYETQLFSQEFQGRDLRLSQLIRTPGYKRDGKPAAPNFAGYTYTGYQPIKYCVDRTSADNGHNSMQNIPIFRYAEVLLNYAEAKAELGTMTSADWSRTIGALRARAGITGGLTSLPVTVDNYLQHTYFPDVTSPVILEVRRERSCELALEGFRFNDIKRWKEGWLMAKRWDGMYVPALNTPMDLDGDGTADVLFYHGTKPTIPSGCAAIEVGAGKGSALTDGDHGTLTWQDDQPQLRRVWYADGRQYLYPIPASAILLNPKLKQNPGWQQ